MSFESALERLEIIVEKLSSEELSLEKSLELYAESGKLIEFCTKTLDEAKLTIEEIFPEDKE